MLEDRIAIRSGIDRGLSLRRIGEEVGRNASTICREVRANGGRRAYAPLTAHRRARELARRPKPTKLGSNPKLCSRVIEDLQRLWSPEQIAQRLREDFEDDQTMRVSHETIYQSIYVQGRGELRKELARCLRTGRAVRKRRGGNQHRGRIPDMVMISERPAEADDRAVPGHWEGDLIIGAAGESQMGTLVERSTRYVMLLHLPTDRTAASVRDAIARKIQTLPESLRRTLTWDQGKELAEHVQLKIDTGIDVYFCDPHSPWQRGSNENTNGLLRQYLPKGTDISVHDEKKLEEIADSLNGRPRKTLAWKTPSEKLAELVAATP
jgi:IS30 family transposase